MSPLTQLEIAAVLFVATHLLMSHPLRRLLVRALGERGFAGVYSLVALVLLIWMIRSARAIGPEVPRWDLGDGGLAVGALLMWFGSILFVGSFRGNPALASPGGHTKVPDEPTGVFRITRHPMMWAFGLWAVTHGIVNPTPSGLVIAEAIFVLAIVGSALQDYKKKRLVGDPWRSWEQRSPFFPFAAGLALPSATALIGGTLLFLAATWAHGALGYRLAAPWNWLS